MKKIDELSFPSSCLNKAKDDEFIFVLLERDRAAPYALKQWVEQRIKMGLNKEEDGEILETLQWIDHCMSHNDIRDRKLSDFVDDIRQRATINLNKNRLF